MSIPAYNQALSDVQYTVTGSLFKPDPIYLLENLYELRELDSLTSQEKESILEPTIKILTSLVPEENFLANKTSQSKYLIELVEALLQRNHLVYYKSAYKDLLAFQAVVNILHHEMLSSKIGNTVERTLFPLASWGNVPGPTTYCPTKPLPKKIFFDLSDKPVTIVKLPANLKNGGIVAWSSIGHEIGGHSFLRSIPGLLDELKEKIATSINNLPEKTFKNPSEKQKMVEYWKACTEELASDVLGILNLGPAFAVGLAVYLKGQNEDSLMNIKGILHSNDLPSARTIRLDSDHSSKFNLYITDLNRDIRLPNSGYFGKCKIEQQESILKFEKLFIPAGKHPVDILRIFAVSEVIKILEIGGANTTYIDLLEQLIKNELENLEDGQLKFKKIFKLNSQLTSEIFTFPIDSAKKIAACAAKSVATSSLNSLGGDTLQNLISWNVVDENIVKNIRAQFSKTLVGLSTPQLATHEQLVGRHILAASILQSIDGKSRIEGIFHQMKHWLRDEAKKTIPQDNLFDSSDSETDSETSTETLDEKMFEKILPGPDQNSKGSSSDDD
ncbi:MAG: hypothetical protein K940chlam9_00386 [Chlamydiae bacterium]|nr:hypothetical protein [Chlamydiota bacterium]